MKWNVFSLEAVKTTLEPKFVLEKVRYVTVHGVLINSTMYLRESEIKQVAQLIKDEKLRNRILTLMRSHRRIVTAPEKENRNIREIASAQMLGQG